jgi:hypothetical protein
MYTQNCFCFFNGEILKLLYKNDSSGLYGLYKWHNYPITKVMSQTCSIINCLTYWYLCSNSEVVCIWYLYEIIQHILFFLQITMWDLTNGKLIRTITDAHPPGTAVLHIKVIIFIYHVSLLKRYL